MHNFPFHARIVWPAENLEIESELMMKNDKRANSLLATALLAVLLFACQPSWQLPVTDQSGVNSLITKQDVMFYREKSDETVDAVPLGQMLYHLGYTLIDEMTLEIHNGDTYSFIWDEIAASAFISESGEIKIGDKEFQPEQLQIKKSDLASEIDYSIIDIAPTVAFALGLPELADSSGEVRITHTVERDHAVLILLDGLQYGILETAANEGLLPFIAQQDMLQKGLTVYPPITNSASAALLTGTPPLVNSVYGYGYRETGQTTLFDLAASEGKSVAAIEGASLPFALRNAETALSGDRDGNGYSDDNVLKNSLDIIQNELPDLLYIHFHDIDDMGHTYGPDSQEYLSALQRVDEYLAQIFNALPLNTFIIIFADHGMHATADGGNHGTLTADDLVVPIMFLEK